MFDHTVEYFETPEQKDRLVSALNCVCAVRPYLSGLAVLLKIYVSNALETAGVTASGRLLINPQFMEHLNVRDLTFVLAHELMHLVLQTHEREGQFVNHELINIAHDFIINDDLMDDFAVDSDRPPANALCWHDYEYLISDWKPAREYSLEELVTLLNKTNLHYPRKSWHFNKSYSMPPDTSLSGGGGGGSLGSLLKEAGVTASDFNPQNPSGQHEDGSPDAPPPKNVAPKGTLTNNQWDVLSDIDERYIFPDLTHQDEAKEKKVIHEAAVRSYSEAVLAENMAKTGKEQSHGLEAGDSFSMIQMLRGSFVTPWEAALQSWFDAATPGDRSFARASRRGAWRTDVVLPGRKREGWTLHIVLDTSGSMSDSLQSALGAIDHFCQNNNVETVHILQCDVGVTADEWLEVGTLENFQAKGFGGSDMTPAMLRLAEDPEVTAVIVLTDGYIDYPEQEPPYETLWVIVDNGNTDFNYGTVIPIDTSENY